MHPGATLFVDVAVQVDLWPDGSSPIMQPEQARNAVALFELARDLGVRQGGLVCRHDGGPSAAPAAPGLPPHCAGPDAGRRRPHGAIPVLPMWITTVDQTPGTEMPDDRRHAVYVDSGCGADPDATPERKRAFTHLTSGIRDAVVFGAGVEHGLDRAVDALLRRRVRVHVALDAAGAADEVAAQIVVAAWKRRGVDGTTVAMIARALRRS
jgi:hypothetical protein